jgi:hypothetical protein
MVTRKGHRNCALFSNDVGGADLEDLDNVLRLAGPERRRRGVALP